MISAIISEGRVSILLHGFVVGGVEGVAIVSWLELGTTMELVE